MMPYGLGFEPNDYQALLGLQIELKVLGRNCKAIAKKLGRKVHRKLK